MLKAPMCSPKCCDWAFLLHVYSSPAFFFLKSVFLNKMCLTFCQEGLLMERLEFRILLQHKSYDLKFIQYIYLFFYFLWILCFFSDNHKDIVKNNE